MSDTRREMILRVPIGPQTLVEIVIIGEPLDVEALDHLAEALALVRRAIQAAPEPPEPGSSS